MKASFPAAGVSEETALKNSAAKSFSEIFAWVLLVWVFVFFS